MPGGKGEGEQLVTWPEQVEEAPKRERVDAVTVVHSKTSTGVLNPLPEIAKVVRCPPDVLLVDALSFCHNLREGGRLREALSQPPQFDLHPEIPYNKRPMPAPDQAQVR